MLIGGIVVGMLMFASPALAGEEDATEELQAPSSTTTTTTTTTTTLPPTEEPEPVPENRCDRKYPRGEPGTSCPIQTKAPACLSGWAIAKIWADNAEHPSEHPNTFVLGGNVVVWGPEGYTRLDGTWVPGPEMTGGAPWIDARIPANGNSLTLLVVFGDSGVMSADGWFDWTCEEPEGSTITPRKVVVNDDGGTAVQGDFGITFDGNAVEWDESIDVIAGTYTLAELQLEGYTLVSVTVDGEAVETSESVTITLGAGEDVELTFTNDDVAPPKEPTVGDASAICLEDGSTQVLFSRVSGSEDISFAVIDGNGDEVIFVLSQGQDTMTETLPNGAYWIMWNGGQVDVEPCPLPPTEEPPERPECVWSIDMVVDNENPKPGDLVHVSTTSTNVGGADCTGSGSRGEQEDDPSLEFVSASCTNGNLGWYHMPAYDPETQKISCNAGTVKPSASFRINGTYRVPELEPCGSYEAEVSARTTSREYNPGHWHTGDEGLNWAPGEHVHINFDVECSSPVDDRPDEDKTPSAVDDSDDKSNGTDDGSKDEVVDLALVAVAEVERIRAELFGFVMKLLNEMQISDDPALPDSTVGRGESFPWNVLILGLVLGALATFVAGRLGRNRQTSGGDILPTDSDTLPTPGDDTS